MAKKILLQICFLSVVMLCHYGHIRLASIPQGVQHITGMVREIPHRGRCFQSVVIGAYTASWYSCRILPMHAGEVWSITAKLKPLMNLNNPGGFDYVRWAQDQGIEATATILAAHKVGESGSLAAIFLRIKERIYRSLLSHIHDVSLANVLAELTLDVRQNLDFDTQQLFTLTGTQHLLAISGSHIVLMLAFFYVVFLWMAKPLVAFFRRGDAHSIALIASAILIMVYVLLIDGGVPVIRALLMFALFVLSFLRRRKLCFYYQWWLAMFVVLCLWPTSITSPSFWLSFLAVIFLYVISTQMIRHQSKYVQYFTAQCLLSLLLLPCSLFWFSQWSLSGIVVNWVTIPWIGFILLPLTFVAEALTYAHLSCHALWLVIDWLGHGLLAFLHSVVRIKSLVIYGHLGLFGFHAIPYGGIELSVLNVGQGLASVVRTQQHVLVYDTGPSFLSGSDMGQKAVLPYLHYLGTNTIDEMVISHGDNDHIGGAQTLIHYADVKHIFTSVPERFHQASTMCLRGDHWEWDGVRFEFLYPDVSHQHLGNDSSCVLKITGKQHTILLTGDIEQLAENSLLQWGSDQLKSSVIVVPHHGSKTSSIQTFVQSVHPQIAVFPYGYHNRFHFPNPFVVQRYVALGSEVRATDRGAVVLYE